ncbi:MAG: COX15/CtaA family protein [bacterium]|nr:COX15/CtaA family protein [bacterium]
MSAVKRERPSRLFIGLALTTVLMTLGLIVFGAVVRVTDSGLGCGNEWPTCHGSLIPPLDNITAWIEWLHRLFAVMIGLFGLGMLAVALAAYRKRNRFVLMATTAAAILFALQSTLGALVVVLDLPPTMVTLHLGTAMLLLGALLVSFLSAAYRTTHTYAKDRFTILAYLTTALSLVIILTGALVRGSGATLACTDWPLCNGEVLPFNQGTLATIHMLHRAAVLGLGVALILLTAYAFRTRQSTMIRAFAVGAFTVYLMQAGVGAMYVISAAAPIWGASHVGLAALTWAMLVALSTIETANSTAVSRAHESEARPEWQPTSEAAVTR